MTDTDIGDLLGLVGMDVGKAVLSAGAGSVAFAGVLMASGLTTLPVIASIAGVVFFTSVVAYGLEVADKSLGITEYVQDELNEVWSYLEGVFDKDYGEETKRTAS